MKVPGRGPESRVAWSSSRVMRPFPMYVRLGLQWSPVSLPSSWWLLEVFMQTEVRFIGRHQTGRHQTGAPD